MDTTECNAGLSRQAKVILEELRSVVTHPTADQVFEMARRIIPRISLGTVYRNLDTMSESGLIQKIHVAGTQKRFDGNPKPHYHIRCSECGRVDDVMIGPLSHIESEASDATGYNVTAHNVEFIGLCPTCSAKITNS